MGMESVFRLSVIMGLTDKLTAPLQGAGNQVEASVKKMNDAFGTMQKAGAVLAGAGAGITTACLSTVAATFDTQDALGELASLGVEDLKAIENAAKGFSDTWAGTTKSDFITASYDIKSGIASLTDEGVAQFTELAALTGKATKSSTEEMGSLFATAYGIYKGAYDDMSDLEFGEMFSAGIATAVKNYKTAGSEMASAISVLGATATNNNISMEEQLAILGQLQTTMSGSEAATKYKAFLNSAASAGDKLGLSFVDANNQLLTTPEILQLLKDRYGDTIDAVEKQQLKAAFGTDEAVAMIDLLYNDIGGLTSGIEGLSDSMQQGVDVTTEMAEAIQNTPAQKFQVLKQQIHNNVEELGNQLLPVVNETLDTVSGAIQRGSEWISNNQELLSVIMRVSLGLGVALLVIGSLIGVIGTAGKAVNAVRTSITALKTAWTVLSGAFAASPVGWVILAVMALVAAFVVLWNTSEEFRSFWLQLFDKVKMAVSSAWETLKPALQNLGQKLFELYEAAKPIIEILLTIAGITGTTFVAGFMAAVEGVIAALTPLTDALSALVSFVTNVINAIVALFHGDFSGACDYMKAAVDDVRDFFINGFDAILSFVSGFADGFLDVVGAALDAVGIDADDTIAGIKSTVSGGLEEVKGFFGNIMGAAADTVKEKLDNIRTAYEENGGGIRGIVAAGQEAVSGYFTAGLTFIDNLTGGKLTAIKNKFTSGLQGAVSGVNAVLTSIRDRFNEKMTSISNFVSGIIDKIKGFFNIDFPTPKIKMPHVSITGGFSLMPPSTPKFLIDWYAEGGVMTGPTIFGASSGKLLGGGEAGDEAILPLSALWEKLGSFLHRELDQDKSREKESAGKIVSALTRREIRTVESHETKQTEREIRQEREKDRKGTTIQKLEVKADISKLKDLPLLFKLLDEIRDAQSGDEPEPA